MAETITINLDTAARGPAGADGAATFTALTDAPSTYSGQALKFVRVNSGATALEFSAVSGTGDALVSGTLDQFADVTQTGGATLAISASTTLNGGTHSGTNTGDQTAASLGLVIGTNVQAYDADLAAIAGLTSAADKVIYYTGSGTAALADLPSFGRTLIANTTAALARADLLVPASDPTGVTGADAIDNIISLTQAEYDAIGSPSASTYYIITDAVDSVLNETHAANHTLTAAECYGAFYTITSAAILTLPAGSNGMSLTVTTRGAVAGSVKAGASDFIYLDGVALDDGDKITNSSTSGDTVVLFANSSGNWTAITDGNWTDGGA